MKPSDVNKDVILSILNNNAQIGKWLLDAYSEENNKPVLSNSDYELGLHMGATQQAIDMALSYYSEKFGIVKIIKNNEILKYY